LYQQAENKPLKGFLKGKKKEIIILFAIALVLAFASWKVFFKSDNTEKTANVSSVQTEAEQKLSGLLKQIDGVGEAEVMICETEEGVQSVVVVCSGARDLNVVMDIREAVAAALGTQEKSVKIYLKKE